MLVITGAGDAFCSGADLTAAGGDGGPGGAGASVASMRFVGRAALRLHELPIPTIAAVNGVAAGAGCNLALGCDSIVASDRARFTEIFAKRGLALDFGGSWLLPRLIGLHRAKELAFLAEIIDATEAERIGLVNRVVPHDELDAEVGALAARLAAMPPLQLAVIKRQLNDAHGPHDGRSGRVRRRRAVADVLVARHRGGDDRVHRETRAALHGRVTASR